MTRIEPRPTPLPQPWTQLLVALLVGAGLAGVSTVWALWVAR